MSKAERHGDVGESGVEAGPGLTSGVGGKLVVQHREGRVAARQRVTRQALEEMRTPLVQVQDPRRQAVGVQAQPQDVDRRLEELVCHALDEEAERTVGRDEAQCRSMTSAG